MGACMHANYSGQTISYIFARLFSPLFRLPTNKQIISMVRLLHELEPTSSLKLIWFLVAGCHRAAWNKRKKKMSLSGDIPAMMLKWKGVIRSIYPDLISSFYSDENEKHKRQYSLQHFNKQNKIMEKQSVWNQQKAAHMIRTMTHWIKMMRCRMHDDDGRINRSKGHWVSTNKITDAIALNLECTRRSGQQQTTAKCQKYIGVYQYPSFKEYWINFGLQ